MASHPYSPRNASTISIDTSSENSRPYADRLVLPPLSYPSGSDDRHSNPPKYSIQGPPVTFPPLQTFQYGQPYPYQHPAERPTFMAHEQTQALKYATLPSSPYEFVAGKPANPETRQIRKIGQRRDIPDDTYRVDCKLEPVPTRPYVQSKPSIRQSPQARDFHSSRATVPDTDRAAENRLLEVDTIPRELKKRPSSGGIPKSKEQKTRDKHSLLPIYDLMRSDSRPGPTYTINMRQQPIAARACGFGERDRRVIDPPPILEVKIEDPSATAEELKSRLRYPYYVVHCSLWNADHDIDNTAMDDVGDRPNQQRRLMGTLVASPFVGEDEHGVEGCFFCFPDLSCRTTGRYRLKFVLLVLDPSKMKTGNEVPFASTIISEVVTVYAAKDFPGMQSSTPLTRRLKEQGCLISVKKGVEKIGEKSGDVKRADSDEDEEDEAEVKPGRSRARNYRS